MDFFFFISKLFLVYNEKQFDKGYVMFLFKNWLNVFDFIFRFLLKVVGVLEMGGGFMQIIFLFDGFFLVYMFIF